MEPEDSLNRLIGPHLQYVEPESESDQCHR